MGYEERAPINPILFGGLDTHHNELFTPGTHSPYMRNAHLFPVGSVAKRAGLLALAYGSGTRAVIPGTGPCKFLEFLSKTTKNTGHLFSSRDGNIFRNNLDDGSSGWVDTGVALDPTADGVTGAVAFYLDETVSPEVGYDDCLYLADGKSKPLILTADSAAEAKVWPKGVYDATPANQVRGYPDRWEDPKGDGSVTDWPRHLAVTGRGFGIRMMAFGFDLDPQRIDFSEAGVPYNFLSRDLSAAPSDPKAEVVPLIDGGFFYALRGDGDPVVSVHTMADYIVVSKKFKTLLYSGIQTPEPSATNPFGLRRVFPIGAVSHESVVAVGNDLYFWSPEGPRRLSTTFTHGDLMQDTISDEIQEIAKNVSFSNQSRIVGRHEPELGRVIWHIPSGGNLTNNLAVAFYYPGPLDNQGRWTVFDGRYSEMVSTVRGRPLLQEFNRSYGAGVNGTVYEMNVGTVDDYNDSGGGVFDDPEPIRFEYQTAWAVLSSLLEYNKGISLTLVVSDEGFGDTKIFYGWDYKTDWFDVQDVINVVAGEDSGYWDSAIWDGSAVWNDPRRALLKFMLDERGRVVRFRLVDDSENGCGFGGLIIDARRKGSR